MASFGMDPGAFEKVPGTARRFRLKANPETTFSRRQYIVLTEGVTPQEKAAERRAAGIKSPLSNYTESLDRYIEKQSELGIEIGRGEARTKLKPIRLRTREMFKKIGQLRKEAKLAKTKAQADAIYRRIDNLERPGGQLAKDLEKFTRRPAGADWVVGDSDPESRE
jgi:hypothetical protein